MARKPLVELYIRNLMESDQRIVAALKKDKKFQKLLGKLKAIDDELESELDRIITDPELKSARNRFKKKDMLDYFREL
jgi:hypothetical protein